jgi:hypothetical protein
MGERVKAAITTRGNHSIRMNAIQHKRDCAVQERGRGETVEGCNQVIETCVLARGVDPEVHSLGMTGRFPRTVLSLTSDEKVWIGANVSGLAVVYA